MAPQSLEALPDPQTIARQKDDYLKALDDEFNHGTQELGAQIQARKQLLMDMAAQKKAEYSAQVEGQVQAQHLALDQQYQQQLSLLQQKASAQKSSLEQQALKLTMEYQQRANFEQMRQQQADMQAQQAELVRKQQEEMSKLQVQQMELANEYATITGARPTTQYAPPPPTMVTGIPMTGASTPPVAGFPISPR